MEKRRGSGGGFGIIMVLIALAFIVGPFMTDAIGGVSRLILLGFGVALFLVGGIVLIITRLYVKTSADEAIVRTGMGGQKVIIDGGTIVIPVVHQVVPVSLATMRLDVDRKGPDALITGDKLRADIRAEFYIKVEKGKEAVTAAATSLGDRSVNAESIKLLVMEKLVSALRTVAATKDLEELNSKRDEFAEAVQKIVSNDLKHNGLTLESVTVSLLDQTDPGTMQGDKNVFDAQGLRKIAEVTQSMRVEKNKLEREADQKVKQQDVERDKFIFTQDVSRESAEAEKDRDIKNAQATAKQEAESLAAEKDELARVREVKRDQAVEVARREQDQAVQVAEVERDKAKQVADVAREQEVAKQNKAKADAEAAQATAEAAREKERQSIQTVAVTEQAKREAEKKYIEEARKIDQEAYKVEREAKARKEAAENDATARTTKATAERTALEAEAAGKQAGEMIPVNVANATVDVDKRRVAEVLQPELKAKADFQEISVKLEVSLKQIEVDGQVRIEQAKAYGTALSTAKMTIFGDPTTLGTMTGMFNNGLQVTQLIEGVAGTISPNGHKLVADLLSGVKTAVSEIFRGVFGKSVSNDVIDDLTQKLVEQPGMLETLKAKVAEGISELDLAGYLSKTFGKKFDLATATTLITTIKENPGILNQLSQALSVLTTAKVAN